jgi:hypothetical protein
MSRAEFEGQRKEQRVISDYESSVNVAYIVNDGREYEHYGN